MQPKSLLSLQRAQGADMRRRELHLSAPPPGAALTSHLHRKKFPSGNISTIGIKANVYSHQKKVKKNQTKKPRHFICNTTRTQAQGCSSGPTAGTQGWHSPMRRACGLAAVLISHSRRSTRGAHTRGIFHKSSWSPTVVWA